VRNPFRSEAEAFQLVWLSIVYFALIVAASFVSTWLGLVVFLVLTGVAVWLIRGGRREAPEKVRFARGGGENERRILVVANETVGGQELRELLEQKAAGVREQILVVCPALNSRLRHWASDEDPARARAQQRLDASLAKLARLGIDARGEIGDGDPLQALEDAQRTFGAAEIVISTHPPGRSHWLERGVVDAARQRFDVPVTHVVVDIEHQELPAGVESSSLNGA
jgi:nucleotide-binding universal stress UspA family protein